MNMRIESSSACLLLPPARARSVNQVKFAVSVIAEFIVIVGEMLVPV